MLPCYTDINAAQKKKKKRKKTERNLHLKAILPNSEGFFFKKTLTIAWAMTESDSSPMYGKGYAKYKNDVRTKLDKTI